MSNTESFDRLEAERAPASDFDVRYGRNGPTERELRLIGDVASKRTLDLGTASGQAAVAFAKHGATSIALDPSTERVAAARALADSAGAKVEWHSGDLSELAFLRADSIDVVFSAYALGEIDDVGRLFRQVHRVLHPAGLFVFSYEHPLATALRAQRSVFDDAPLVVDRNGTRTSIHLHPVASVVTALGRAGFRVDAIVEPEPPATALERAKLPTTIVWRARKEGV